MTRRFIIFCLVSLCSPALLHADLVLHIDTATEQFSFSGSDSGTPNVINQIGWILDSGFGGAGQLLPPVVSGFDTAGATLEGTFFQVRSGPPDLVLLLNFDAVGPGPIGSVTITGNGSSFSYAALSAPQKADFESFVGSTVPLFSGTGASSLSVQGPAVVPEPGSIACIGITCLSLVAIRRRKADMGEHSPAC